MYRRKIKNADYCGVSRVHTRGIGFGSRAVVKPAVSDRELLLILGILVAIIISVTTWLQDGDGKSGRITPPFSPKANSIQVVKKWGQVVFKINTKVLFRTR